MIIYRTIIIIYALLIYHNMHGIDFSLSTLFIIIFPSFFIATTAMINTNYLNPFHTSTIGIKYTHQDFYYDLITLDNLNYNFITVFLPIYLILQYLMYGKYIRKIIFNIKNKYNYNLSLYYKDILSSNKKYLKTIFNSLYKPIRKMKQ